MATPTIRTTAQVLKETQERTKPKVKAKGDADKPKKVDARKVLNGLTHSLLPEEKFICDRFDDGTCHEDPTFSLAALGEPDVEYQARDIKINQDHSSRFAAHLLGGKELFPVVIFRSIIRSIIKGVRQETVKLILADGFHRHHAHVKAGRTSIPAYVIDVPEDQLDSQARLFAAMCNQLAVLKRSDEDKRAAIRMICAVQECETWTAERIATHCGVHPDTADKYRKEWAIEHKKNLPKTSRKRKAEPGIVVTTSGDADKPVTIVISESSPAKTLAPDVEIEPSPSEIGATLHNSEKFRKWLRDYKGVIAKPPEAGLTVGFYLNGLVAGDLAFVLCDGTDVSDAYHAIGRALVLKNLAAPESRAVVVLRKQGRAAHRKLYELGPKLGVEFLTPQELVDAVKAGDEETS